MPPILVAALLVVVVQAGLGLLVVPDVWRGEFLDADCHMRLLRVIELAAGGPWYDSISERTDAPFGEFINWSRPLDLLLLPGAWAGALNFWAAIISPVLLLLALPWLDRLMRPHLGRWGVLAVMLLLIMPQASMAFMVGRPDHHSLLALLFLALLALLAEATRGRQDTGLGLGIGLVVGASVWVSVEAMVAGAFAGAALLLLWIWDGESRRLAQATTAAAGAMAVAVLAVALEWPPADWLRPVYSKISIVHLALLAACAGSVTLLTLAERRWPVDCVYCRFFRAAIAASTAAAAMALLYPDFFRNPMAADMPDAPDWHLSLIGEHMPLIPTDRSRGAMFLAQLGLPLVAAFGTLVRWRRLDSGMRRVLAVMLLGTAAYLPLSLMQVRWASYPQLLALLPLLLLLRDVLRQQWRWRAVAAAALVGGPFALAAATAPRAAPAEGPGCGWPALYRHLATQPPRPDDNILLTYAFQGVPIVWHSAWRVVAAPYIFNTGLQETRQAFSAISDERLRNMVQRRGVAMLLLCGADAEAQYYRAHDGESVHDRLARGEAPGWLEPVKLPKELDGFRLYRRRDDR